jgi:hypothetical protein
MMLSPQTESQMAKTRSNPKSAKTAAKKDAAPARTTAGKTQSAKIASQSQPKGKSPSKQEEVLCAASTAQGDHH